MESEEEEESCQNLQSICHCPTEQIRVSLLVHRGAVEQHSEVVPSRVDISAGRLPGSPDGKARPLAALERAAPALAAAPLGHVGAVSLAAKHREGALQPCPTLLVSSRPATLADTLAIDQLAVAAARGHPEQGIYHKDGHILKRRGGRKEGNRRGRGIEGGGGRWMARAAYGVVPPPFHVWGDAIAQNLQRLPALLAVRNGAEAHEQKEPKQGSWTIHGVVVRLDLREVIQIAIGDRWKCPCVPPPPCRPAMSRHVCIDRICNYLIHVSSSPSASRPSDSE